MTRTIATKESVLPDDSSPAYSTLDNGEPYNVPLPGNSANTAMGSAAGLLSTANDLAKYYKALMRLWYDQAQLENVYPRIDDKKAVSDDVSWLFAPLQIMQKPAFRKKSYAAGWARSQLATTIGDVGVNPGLVEKMPLLANGIGSRLALWHQGSLVGATSFVMLLPGTQSAFLVLTNTMAINDAADWIGQLLVGTLLDSPIRNDYVHLASLSADCALEKYTELRALSDYVGFYAGFGGILRIEVVENGNKLEMLFQGRESQKFRLQHHHHDTITLFTLWNEQVKRAQFIGIHLPVYSIRFQARQGERPFALNLVHDSAMPEGEDSVKE